MVEKHKLRLTAKEETMLHGDEGIAVQRAMEIVVALANIYGARHLVPVTSVQVAGVSYKNLGQAGLDFLREWAEQGAQVRVPTTLNPAGMDMARWRALGFSKDFARQQRAVINAYTAMGITPTCTCTPYLVGNLPTYGNHIAWAESSAVSFANSVLGARTNREGGPSALAAALTGRTAAYGLHLDEHRIAHYRVDVHCQLQTSSDWSALGYLVGRQVRNGVPYFVLHDQRSGLCDQRSGLCDQRSGLCDQRSGLCDQRSVSDDEQRKALNRCSQSDDPLIDKLKSLGAAMAASGAVALYHIDGITPESQQRNVLSPNAQRIDIDDVQPGYRTLNPVMRPAVSPRTRMNSNAQKIDLVSIGCPHASAREILSIAQSLSGKQLEAALWVTTARETRERTAAEVEIIEAAGGKVVADTCMVVAPVAQLGFWVMATNSAKMALYTPSHSGLDVRFGTLAQCIQAAITGRWSRLA